MDDATAQSQNFRSQQGPAPAVSGSAEAQAGSGHVVDGAADCERDVEPSVQPREGTPVSSNRRQYRVSFCCQTFTCQNLCMTRAAKGSRSTVSACQLQWAPCMVACQRL